MRSATLIASRKHLVITLAIMAAVTLIGVQQAAGGTTSTASPSSRLPLYFALMTLQWAWVWYVRTGLRRTGHSLADLIGRVWTLRSVTADVLLGIVGFAAAHFILIGVKSVVGNEANTTLLLPQGLTESIVWVAVSLTAGISEEIVFRGYLQRQFAALTGSAVAALLLQAALFGVAHGYQGRASIATTGAYGLTMGVLAIARRHVRACAIAHASTDIVGGLLR